MLCFIQEAITIYACITFTYRIPLYKWGKSHVYQVCFTITVLLILNKPNFAHHENDTLNGSNIHTFPQHDTDFQWHELLLQEFNYLNLLC